MLDTILNTLMKPTKLEKEQLKSLEFHNDLPIDVYCQGQFKNVGFRQKEM